MVECTGLENQQSRKALVGSNPTASAIVLMAVTTAFLTAGCLYVPGETLTDGPRQRAVKNEVLTQAKSARPDCRQQSITDSVIVDLHGDGKVAVERWTVTQCGERVHYRVSFPPAGRGTGFLVKPDK